MPDRLKCAAQHFGPWMVQPAWLSRAVSAVKDGTFQAACSSDMDDEDRGYALDGDVAIVPIMGQIVKGESSYGGASSVRTIQVLRSVYNDKEIRGAMIHIDSPGGTVAGTPELADAIARLAAAKPTHGHFEDLGASAAFWAGSQASFLSANATAFVGCIGTVAVVEDASGAFEKEGVKVHVVATGDYKGAFTYGAPVEKEHLEYLQEQVDDLNEFFLAGVARGRNMSMADVRKLADGRDFIASKAVSMGLIDAVMSFDDAMANLKASLPQGTPKRTSASTRIRLSSM